MKIAGYKGQRLNKRDKEDRVKGKMVGITEDEKIPREILDELRLQGMRWERTREQMGLKMTDKERIGQLEQQIAFLKESIVEQCRIMNGVCWAVAVLALSLLAHILGSVLSK